PCGTGIPAAGKNVTGLWAEPSGAVNTYNLVQTGPTTVTATANIPATRNETLSFGAITFDGTNLTIHFTYGFPKATPPFTGSETLFFKLSADGNTLTGTYVYTTSLSDAGSGSITWVRNTGTAVLVPSTVTLQGTPGGAKVTDNTSLTLWNCGGGPANFNLSTM